MAAVRTLPLGAGYGEEPGLDIYIIYLRIYISTYLHIYSCQESDKQQQRGVHDADHGHGGQPPVPRHAAALHLQGPRLHHGLLDIIQTELGGAQTYTRAYQRGICTIYDSTY